MKKSIILIGLSVMLAISCTRDEQRAARYDQTECPLCKDNKGVCSYCGGEKTCHYCNGSGKRSTVIDRISNQKTTYLKYEETCPYCKGNATCQYCKGDGKCWASGSGGTVENWDFLKKR